MWDYCRREFKRLLFDLLDILKCLWFCWLCDYKVQKIGVKRYLLLSNFNLMLCVTNCWLRINKWDFLEDVISAEIKVATRWKPTYFINNFVYGNSSRYIIDINGFPGYLATLAAIHINHDKLATMNVHYSILVQIYHKINTLYLLKRKRNVTVYLVEYFMSKWKLKLSLENYMYDYM